jgi:hypothetical protein
MACSYPIIPLNLRPRFILHGLCLQIPSVNHAKDACVPRKRCASFPAKFV